MRDVQETQAERREVSGTEPDYPAFNDATEHFQSIVGMPNKRVDLNAMPKFVRWFGYFFYTVLVLGAIAFVVAVAMNH